MLSYCYYGEQLLLIILELFISNVKDYENLKDSMRDEYQDLHVDRSLSFNTLRTGLLNCLNARSRSLTFKQRASCI